MSRLREVLREPRDSGEEDVRFTMRISSGEEIPRYYDHATQRVVVPKPK